MHVYFVKGVNEEYIPEVSCEQVIFLSFGTKDFSFQKKRLIDLCENTCHVWTIVDFARAPKCFYSLPKQTESVTGE